ncbi:hypothetical protein [Avibacterium paragallinarum]|uniref:hypothetical protein n=1 Tax=Avibacterium paragallinarum TaxID=728 RepID=UPI003B75C287
MYSHAHEYHRHHEESQATMQRLIEPFKRSTKLNWQRVIPKITPVICLHTEYRERPATSKRNHQSTRPRPA